MDDLDPILKAKLEKLGISFDTLSASATASSKAASKGILQQLQEAEARKKVLAYLEDELKLGKAEADQVAKRIKRDADIAKKDEARENRNQQIAEQSKKAADKVGSAFAFVASAAGQIASSALAAQQAAYSSKEIFTGASGTIDTFASVAKAAAGALSGLVSMIPIVGAGLGKAMDAATGVIIDMSAQSAKIQLERAQSVFNALNEVSKAGVSFGGNLAYLGSSSQAAGMNLALYTDFIRQALPDLQRLGGTVADSSIRVAKFGKDVAKGNSQLVVMFGGYDGYNAAIADYHAKLASYGVDITSTNKNLKASTLDYLKTQKALTELTGKSADAYEKEARERQQDISWQSALKSFGDKAPLIEMAMSNLQQFGGEGVAKVVREAISNRTLNVNLDRTPENMQFLSMMRNGQQDALNAFIRSSTGGDMVGAMSALRDFATKQGVQAKDMDEFIKNFMSVQGVAQEAMPPGMLAAIQSLAQSSTNMAILDKLPTALGTLINKASQETDESKKLLKLYDTKIKLAQDIDEKVIKGISKTIELTMELYKFQNLIVDKFPDFGNAVDKFVKIVNEMLDKKDNEISKDFWTNELERTGKESEKVAKLRLGRNESPIVGTLANRAPGEGKQASDLTTGPKGGKFKWGAFGMGGTGKSNVLPDFNTITNPDGSKTEGQVSENIISLMKSIDEMFPGTTFIAGAGKHTGGGHRLGRALDFVLPPEYLKHYKDLKDPDSPVTGANDKFPGKWDDRPSLADSNHINNWLKSLGFTKSINEYAYPSRNATGGHFHAEFAKGGIVNPTPGGINATVAEAGQSELITPLKNGMIPGMAQLIELTEQLVRVTREHADYSEKISKSVT